MLGRRKAHTEDTLFAHAKAEMCAAVAVSAGARWKWRVARSVKRAMWAERVYARMWYTGVRSVSEYDRRLRNPAWQSVWAVSTVPTLRQNLAASPHVRPAMTELLALDTESTVRKLVALNPRTPVTVVAQLRDDPDMHVRGAARWRLGLAPYPRTQATYESGD